MKLRTMIALVAMLAAAPAAAVENTVPDATHIASAMTLLEATNAKANMAAIIDALIPVILGQIRKQYPNAKEQPLREFESGLREEMIGGLDDIMKLTARIYAEHFSVEDMQTYTEFFRTDAGKRYIAELPLITKESAAVGAALGKEIATRAVQRALDRLKQKGLTL